MTAPSSGSSRSVSSCRSRDARWVTVATRPSDEAWTGHQKKPWRRWPSCAIWHSGSIPSSSRRAASGRLSSPSPIARRSTSSVDIGSERYSPAVEGAAYFVISEALANVTKYAKATKATVRVRGLDDHLSIEVDDDGIGGADPRSWQRPARSRRPPRCAGRDDHGRQPARWRNADLGADPDHSTYVGPRVSPVCDGLARMARWAA